MFHWTLIHKGWERNIPNEAAHFGYKTMPNGKRFRVAPWEVVTPTVVVYGLYQLVHVHPHTGAQVGHVSLIVTAVVAALIAFGALIYAISTHRTYSPIPGARVAVHDAWNKVCPTIVVVSKNPPAEEVETA